MHDSVATPPPPAAPAQPAANPELLPASNSLSSAVLLTKEDQPSTFTSQLLASPEPGGGGPAPAPNLAFSLQPLALSARSPGETPRAYSAFMTFYQFGHARSLQAVADKLGENLGTVKNWSSKYDWTERLQSFNSGLLQQQAETEAALQRQQAADWAKRVNKFREQQWNAAQKLLAAAQCYLESYGDDQLQKMTLAQVSRALRISSQIGQLALTGAGLPEKIEPALSPIQLQLTAALERMYGKPASPPADATQKSNGEPHKT